MNKLPGKLALIAEDEALLRELIVMELEDYEVSCIEAENGIEALKAIEDNDIDFLLSDIRMPGGSGIDLLKAIKEKQLLKGKPIIMLSGFSDFSVKQAQDLGALTIIPKPFSITEVISLLESSLV